MPRKETPRCTRLSGVMTLEAVVVLPLLAGFFVSILFFFRVLQVELSVQEALDDTARIMAVYLADTDAEAQGALSASSLAAVKTNFIVEMGDYEVADAYITGGKWGISLSSSTMTERNLSLVASYVMTPPVKLPQSLGIQVKQIADCRKWNGWKAGDSEGTAGTYVYVTEHGTVYHTDRTCTYLNPSVKRTTYEEARGTRNDEGRTYRSCSLCAGTLQAGDIVYVTDEGDCYHASLGCGGLKRTVRMVLLSETSFPQCSKCQANGG